MAGLGMINYKQEWIGDTRNLYLCSILINITRLSHCNIFDYDTLLLLMVGNTLKKKTTMNRTEETSGNQNITRKLSRGSKKGLKENDEDRTDSRGKE